MERNGGGLKEGTVRESAADVPRGLMHLHGEINWRKVFIRAEGWPKRTNFGYARIMDSAGVHGA
jgi:hypothetical protein